MIKIHPECWECTDFFSDEVAVCTPCFNGLKKKLDKVRIRSRVRDVYYAHAVRKNAHLTEGGRMPTDEDLFDQIADTVAGA